MAAAVTAPPSLPRVSPRRGRLAAAAGLSSLIRLGALAPAARLSSTVTRPRSSRTEVVSGAADDAVDDDEACELVSGADLVIGGDEEEGSEGGAVRAYLLKAVKNNNGTGVLLLSDIFGFEDSATRDFAYRVACHGYNVLVPDLFRGNPWRKPEKDGFDAWLAGHGAERVSRDIDACTKWLVDEFTAAGVSKKLGIIGFCYGGGRLVETLSRDGGGSYSAGVCFYGTRMDASLAPRLGAPVLFVCGDGDPLCAVETVREMEASARGARAVVYAGRGHGFAHRPQSLEDDGDAEDAFGLMRAWFHDHLLA